MSMGQKSILISIAIIFFALIFMVVFVLNQIQPKTNTKKVEIPVGKTIKAVDVVKDPLVYDELTIEIESQITDWVTKRSFTVVAVPSSTFGGPGKELLVIAKVPFPLPKDVTGNSVGIGETVNVRMKGKVRIMNRIELGRVLGLDLDGTDIKLDDNNISQWNEGSVLLVDTVEKL